MAKGGPSRGGLTGTELLNMAWEASSREERDEFLGQKALMGGPPMSLAQLDSILSGLCSSVLPNGHPLDSVPNRGEVLLVARFDGGRSRWVRDVVFEPESGMLWFRCD